MFEVFQRNFPRDRQDRRGHDVEGLRPDIPGLREFFAAFGGSSFRDGLYRVIAPADLNEWNERICLGFPEFEGRIEDGQKGVVMFEPGTGEALEIPANLFTFHDAGLLEFGEAALAISFYERWRTSGGATPAFDQCIGYKKPLFLGGSDGVENLELSDLDVYWHLMGQFITKAKGLPPRTPISVSLS